MAAPQNSSWGFLLRVAETTPASEAPAPTDVTPWVDDTGYFHWTPGREAHGLPCGASEVVRRGSLFRGPEDRAFLVLGLHRRAPGRRRPAGRHHLPGGQFQLDAAGLSRARNENVEWRGASSS
ncbi:hypothetical protein MTO96_031067 [Rhipicephalus appendiculatus]